MEVIKYLVKGMVLVYLSKMRQKIEPEKVCKQKKVNLIQGKLTVLWLFPDMVNWPNFPDIFQNSLI